jgi:hypothetical protein
VIDDLLYAMLGMDGNFVHLRKLTGEDGNPSVAFEVDGSLEPALQEMVERLLPIWYIPPPPPGLLSCPHNLGPSPTYKAEVLTPKKCTENPNSLTKLKDVHLHMNTNT